MANTWKKAAKGIRYREHENRKHGKRFDRYYTLSYWLDGKSISEGVGWASDGVTQEKCEKILLILKENQRNGIGAITYKEWRQTNQDAAKAEKQQEQHEKSLTLQGIFADGYMAAQHGKDDASLKAEKRLMRNQIAPFFGNTPLRKITPDLMDKFVSQLVTENTVRTGKPLSAATIRYALAVIRQIWNYALSRGLTDTPFPAKNIKAPSTDNKRTRFLNRDEAERLLKALLERSQEMHDMALMSLYCGLRAGELFKLMWDDVNFQEGFVHIRDRKNSESGTAWMTPRIKAMLENRFNGHSPTDLIFPNYNGGMKKEISRVFSKTVQDLGLNEGIADARNKIVFHTLRHTFASWLAQKGVPLHSLAGLMGHKTTTMTQRYAHLSPDVQKAHAMLIDDTPHGGNVILFDHIKAQA